MPTLSDVSTDCKSCCDYIDDMNDVYKSRWLDEFNSYRPNEAAVQELKKVIDDYELVVIFADWCGDARRAIPALAYLENELHIKIRALGGMTKPAWGSSKLWAVPPSPHEVDTFEIKSSPTLIIFKKTGEEIGRMRTRPKMTPTVEEEILKIIKDSSNA
jgi:thiol-disulfide isomerase/thioredoxin